MVDLQRLAMLGQLFAEGARELNDLLALACTYTQLEMHEHDEKRGSEGRLQTIFDMTMVARDAALGVLEFAEPTGARAGQPTQPIVAVETVLRLYEHQLAEKTRFTASGLESLPPVAMPAAHLQLVLAGIVRNAIEAVEGRADERIFLTACQNYGRLILDVWNAGPPISARVKSRLFRERVTTKRQGEGWGLAMMMSSQLVKAAGGRLIARNDPEGGVFFRILLPITAEETPLLPRPRAPETVAPLERLSPTPGTIPIIANAGVTTDTSANVRSALAGRQILVVDDCEPVRAAMLTLLREIAGASVATCASGEQALKLAWSPQHFDAMVLDLHMPSLSGEQTFQRLPAPIKGRVVFLTDDGLQQPESPASNPRPTLLKPVSYAALVEAIRSVSSCQESD
jgi:CheY-like chemotaxis protein